MKLFMVMNKTFSTFAVHLEVQLKENVRIKRKGEVECKIGMFVASYDIMRIKRCLREHSKINAVIK